jgi:hypothetical protein
MQVLQIEAAQGASNADKIEDRQVSPSTWTLALTHCGVSCAAFN